MISTYTQLPSGVGCRHEFESLVQQTRRYVYRYAYRLTGNGDDAEDLTQEAYLRAYRAFDRYDKNMPFSRWLFRILLNLFLDWRRRARRCREFSLDQAVETEEEGNRRLIEIADPAANPEKQYLSPIMDERLERALARLPEPFRCTVLLRDVEELSYEEIANTMRTNIGTVRSRIHRGRTLLRQYLSRPAVEEESAGS